MSSVVRNVRDRSVLGRALFVASEMPAAKKMSGKHRGSQLRTKRGADWNETLFVHLAPVFVICMRLPLAFAFSGALMIVDQCWLRDSRSFKMRSLSKWVIDMPR